MELNQDIIEHNYMNTFYLCHVGRDKICEKMVTEHTLVYIVSGEMDVMLPEGRTIHFKKGDAAFLRRNHKVSKEKHPSSNGEPFEALFLHLNTDFLKKFRKDNHIAVPSTSGMRITRQNVFRLEGHPFLKALFLSLADYFQADTYPSKELMESKLREAVYVLLQLKPELTPVLFDFVDQWKVDVKEFMEENFLRYMGTHSGRDGDKVKALGLHTLYTKNGTPYFAEASEVYECRMAYHSTFDPKNFESDLPKNFYAHFNAGYHTEYIGEIEGAWRK